MPCFSPLTASRSTVPINGKYDIRFGSPSGDYVPIQLPCGQCIGCRLQRSKDWASRCVHEAQLHERNAFITLTYDDEHIPADRSLNHRHFQLFMKRLRKKYGKVRYYMCGEYGSETFRPHFHACLFGMDFADKKLYASREGINLYGSESLDALWQKGFCTVGEVSFESAAYISRYITKKITGDLADELDKDGLKHYEWLCPYTGEITEVEPEYTRMSLKPGIGAKWYERYSSDVHTHDHIVINGHKCRPPRYYDKLLEADDPEKLTDLKIVRQIRAIEREADNTRKRLSDKKVCMEAKLNQLKRTL